MQKCVNARDTQVTTQESHCLPACVRALHQTHVRVFTYLKEFEEKREKEETRLALKKEREEQEEAVKEAQRIREDKI